MKFFIIFVAIMNYDEQKKKLGAQVLFFYTLLYKSSTVKAGTLAGALL